MTVAYTVGTGFSYASLTSAIDACPGNLSAQGRQWVQVYYTVGGYAETIDAYTGFSNASAADYIDIEAMVPHYGMRGQGIVVDIGSIAVASRVALYQYGRLHGFCFYTSSIVNAAWNYSILLRHSHIRVYDNIVYFASGLANLANQYAIYSNGSGGNVWVYNNQFIVGDYPGMRTVRFTVGASAGNENVVANNVVQGTGQTQCYEFGGTDYFVIVNNYGQSAANGFYDYGGAHNVFSYNISSDASAGSSNGCLSNKAAANQFVSVTAGSEDLHLKANADCIRDGYNLSATFTKDCEGRTRYRWNTGACEEWQETRLRSLKDPSEVLMKIDDNGDVDTTLVALSPVTTPTNASAFVCVEVEGSTAYGDSLMGDAFSSRFGIASMGLTGSDGAFAVFTVATDGTVTLLVDYNADTTEDHAATMNIYSDGAAVSIQNKLGATHHLAYFVVTIDDAFVTGIDLADLLLHGGQFAFLPDGLLNSATATTNNSRRDLVNISVADDATYDLTAGQAGFGVMQVNDAAEYAVFTFTEAGVATLLANSGNVTTTATTDGKINLISTGTRVQIENKLGSTITGLCLTYGFDAV